MKLLLLLSLALVITACGSSGGGGGDGSSPMPNIQPLEGEKEISEEDLLKIYNQEYKNDFMKIEQGMQYKVSGVRFELTSKPNSNKAILCEVQFDSLFTVTEFNTLLISQLHIQQNTILSPDKECQSVAKKKVEQIEQRRFNDVFDAKGPELPEGFAPKYFDGMKDGMRMFRVFGELEKEGVKITLEALINPKLSALFSIPTFKMKVSGSGYNANSYVIRTQLENADIAKMDLTKYKTVFVPKKKGTF